MYQDIKQFRTKIKDRTPALKGNQYVNEHFMGVQHEMTTGFFQIFHGVKNEISDFLRGAFDMAEDSQAIFEFIQNAADCRSTHFCLFFDDEHFLAINNGEMFSEGGVESILNIGQSYGKKTGDTIGRFGVGFKLVHRLVGISDGLDEIVNKGAGPILFSWSKDVELRDFLDSSKGFAEMSSNPESAPWLLKILLTCFPTQVKEVVKNLKYEDTIAFTESELLDCRKFTISNLSTMDISMFKQGSLFYLHLGKGKADALHKEAKELERGASVSLRFLNRLTSITLNKQNIYSSLNWLKPGCIPSDSEEFQNIGLIDDKSKNYPLRIEVGYKQVADPDYNLSNTPNFYKYFPIGDEINKLQFVIHCNAFLIGTNRRHLHSDPINQRILFAVSRLIQTRLDEAKDVSPEIFRDFFVAILLSQSPNETRNEWQKDCLYAPLVEYIKENTPTSDGKYWPQNAVIIKNSRLDILPSIWGIEKSWFYWPKWSEEAWVKPIVNEAERKLELKVWGVEDLIRNADTDKIKQWCLSINWESSEVSKLFYEEISTISEHQWGISNNYLFEKLTKIPILKVKNEAIPISILDALCREDIIIDLGLLNAKTEIEKAGLKIIETPFGGEIINARIKKIVPYLLDNTKMFDRLSSKIIPALHSGEVIYTAAEKLAILKCFNHLVPDSPSKVRQLKLFRDSIGKYRPMFEILTPQHDSKSLLDQYRIHKDDYLEEADLDIQKYLNDSSELYHLIIFPHWNSLSDKLNISNYPNWLDMVIKAYNDSSNKVQIVDKNIFLTENTSGVDEWFTPKDFFFHSNISALNSLAYLKVNTTFKSIWGYSLPTPICSKLLELPPFSVQSNLVKSIGYDKISATIDHADLQAFIGFLSSAGEDFFEYFVIFQIKDTNLISIESKKHGQFQYQDDSNAFSRIISEYLPNDGFRMPTNFSHPAPKSNYILSAGELQKEILTRLKSIQYKIVSQIAPLLTTVENVKLLLNNSHSPLQIQERESYREGDDELIWLKLALNWLEGDDLIKLRKRIVIRPLQGELYNLDKSPANDSVKIGGFTLSISKIFAFNEDYKKSFISHKIMKTLFRTNLDRSKLEQLFGASEQNWEEEKCIEYASEIIEKQNSKIENSHQSAFFAILLHLGILKKSKVQIQTINGEWFLLDSQWLLKEYTFTSRNYILDQRYQDLEKLLNLKSNPDKYFKFGEDGLITADYHFQTNGYLTRIGLLQEPTEEQSLTAIMFLFSLWEALEQPQEFWKKVVIEDWHKTIGFISDQSVYPTDFAFKHEVLPLWLQNWIGSDGKRQDFLIALNVNTLSSPVVKLRQFLRSNSNVSYAEDELIRGFNLTDNKAHMILLENTLHSIENREYSDNITIKILQKISNMLAEHTANIPPYIPILVPKVTGYDEESYTIMSLCEANVFECNENTWSDLTDLGLNKADLFEFASKQQVQLIDQTILPEAWHGRYKLVSFSEPKPDVEKIVAHSEPWEIVEEIELKVFNGDIPELVFIEGIEEPFTVVYKKAYHKIDHILYINNNKKYDVLWDAINEFGWNASNFKLVLSVKKDTPPSSLINFGSNDIIPQWNDYDAETRKEINDEAKRVAADWLRNKGYTVPDPIQSDYYKLLNVKNNLGSPVIVHVRSTKGGFLYLAPQDWSDLAQSNTILIVILPSNKVTSVTFDDLIRRNDRVELQFNAQSFSSEELGLLAQLFAYRRDVKFVFKAPNFNAMDYLQTFGLAERKSIKLSPVSTNLID